MSAPIAWSPSQYLKFADERTRPSRDLLAQISLRAPWRVVDVGCGPGNSTALLAERWPSADVMGIDNSDSMLSQARKSLVRLRFIKADAAHWVPDPDVDLVFANAVYQWVPDHSRQLVRVLQPLRKGAVLAVQMPDNMMEPTHVLMREVAGRKRYAEALKGVARGPLPPAADYYSLLSAETRRLDLWHTVYNHVMSDAAAIVEWVKGTGLSPFLERLAGADRAAFLEDYASEIEKAYPKAPDGRVLLRFPRLFIVAER